MRLSTANSRWSCRMAPRSPGGVAAWLLSHHRPYHLAHFRTRTEIFGEHGLGCLEALRSGRVLGRIDDTTIQRNGSSRWYCCISALRRIPRSHSLQLRPSTPRIVRRLARWHGLAGAERAFAVRNTARICRTGANGSTMTSRPRRLVHLLLFDSPLWWAEWPTRATRRGLLQEERRRKKRTRACRHHHRAMIIYGRAKGKKWRKK